MKVLLYPADDFSCGNLRLNWPAAELRARGLDVFAVETVGRKVKMQVERNTVMNVQVPDDVDVFVFQRPTHLWLAQAIAWLAAQGRTVVVDMDDDLHAIHPANPAYQMLDPRHMASGARDRNGKHWLNSWENVALACEAATLVTVSTPGLLKRYARHGRGVVLPNYLPDHYYGHSRVDNTRVGWPAAVHSHPNDPAVVGSAVARLVKEGRTEFMGFGPTGGLANAFGLPCDPPDRIVDILDWPAAISEIGVGIAPLADTLFNSRKSALKPLELASCGVPVVMSPRREYARLHELGVGVLADSPKQWYSALSELINSPSRRTELSEQGRAAAETLRLRDHAQEYWDAWALAASLPTHGPRATVDA